MIVFSKKRIGMNISCCPKCGSSNSKIMVTQRKADCTDYLPACVKCFDCGFIVGKPKRKDSTVGMFFNPNFAVKAWNNYELL